MYLRKNEIEQLAINRHGFHRIHLKKLIEISKILRSFINALSILSKINLRFSNFDVVIFKKFDVVTETGTTERSAVWHYPLLRVKGIIYSNLLTF